MRQEDYREIIFLLRRLYPRCKRYEDKALLNQWWAIAKDADFRAVQKAAFGAGETPPDMAELVEAAGRVEPVEERGRCSPCPLVCNKPGGGTVGERLAQLFPGPECESCDRRHTTLCWAEGCKTVDPAKQTPEDELIRRHLW